jgi:hypothetical protein
MISHGIWQRVTPLHLAACFRAEGICHAKGDGVFHGILCRIFQCPFENGRRDPAIPFINRYIGTPCNQPGSQGHFLIRQFVPDHRVSIGHRGTTKPGDSPQLLWWFPERIRVFIKEFAFQDASLCIPSERLGPETEKGLFGWYPVNSRATEDFQFRDRTVPIHKDVPCPDPTQRALDKPQLVILVGNIYPGGFLAAGNDERSRQSQREDSFPPGKISLPKRENPDVNHHSFRLKAKDRIILSKFGAGINLPCMRKENCLIANHRFAGKMIVLNQDVMECRIGCGACCIAPSISSPIPGMPDGKPAGVRCIHLTKDYTCGIYDRPDRPEVCDKFKADPAVCGENREEALELLSMLEE